MRGLRTKLKNEENDPLIPYARVLVNYTTMGWDRVKAVSRIPIIYKTMYWNKFLYCIIEGTYTIGGQRVFQSI